MKAMIVSTAVACTLGLAGGLALAQDVPGSDRRLTHLMERFHKADVNDDGHLTRDEARKGLPRVYKHFSEIDTDNKGYVTLDQITAWIAAHPGPGPRGHRGPPPGSAPGSAADSPPASTPASPPSQ